MKNKSKAEVGDSTSKNITILLRNTIVTGFLLWLSEIILILHSKE